MRVFIEPSYAKKDKGEGGIRRVVEMQRKYLPQLGVELVDEPALADVVNCHATELVRHPVIAHSCHGLYWSDYQWAGWAHTANLRILEMMKEAQVVTVPSEWVANAVRRGTLINPIVCPHGIEPDEWEPIPTQGYVFWGKNRPDPVCDPADMNRLASISQNLPFVSTFGVETPNVKLIGQRPFAEIKPVLQGAAVYLATVMETGGITLLESMISAVPAVGWAHGANLDLIDHMETGYLARPGDFQDLREGLLYCLANRERLGLAARDKAIEQYDWKDRIRAYVGAYEQALGIAQAEQPQVSVIVTAHNLERYLPACLNSILAQTSKDWELVIVDDASPDSCGRIADSFKAENPERRILVIHNTTNKYLAESRNIGIRQSSGKYIIALDADDELAPYALELLSRSLSKGKSLDIVTGAMELIEPDGRRWVSEWPPEHPSYESQIQSHNQVPYASMYRRWVWERTGGYRRRMRSAEDAEFWARAMSYGARPAKVTDAPTLIYNNRPASMSHSIPTPDWTQWLTWSKIPEIAPSGADAQGDLVHSYHPLEISVVIPCGPGHEIYLQDALDSLVAQTFLAWEAIVVNDTGHPIDEWLAGFPFVRLIDPSARVGVAKARNLGVSAAKSALIALLDADDFYQPLALESYYQAWQKHKGWVYSDWLDQNGERKEAQNWNADQLLEKMLGPSTGLYARSDLMLVGGFDENIPGWEDWSTHLRLLARGICGSRIAAPLFTYRYQTGRRREENFDHSNDLLQYIKQEYSALGDEKIMAGCRSCGGGGGVGGAIQIQKAIGAGAGSAPPSEPDMVLIEYVGAQTQFQTVRSKFNAERMYRYGGDPGAPDRLFYVYAQDVPWLTVYPDFVVAGVAPVSATTPSASVAPTLYADRTPDPAPVESIMKQTSDPLSSAMPLETLKIDGEIVSILRKAGYETVEQVRLASVAELSSVKGMGPARVKKVQHALA